MVADTNPFRGARLGDRMVSGTAVAFRSQAATEHRSSATTRTKLAADPRAAACHHRKASATVSIARCFSSSCVCRRDLSAASNKPAAPPGRRA